MNTIELKVDSTEAMNCIDQLLSDLANAPHEVRKLALDFLDLSPELVCFEFGVTSRAVMTALLKPTQRLLDLRVAVRTGNFDLLVVKHSHGDSPGVIVGDTSNSN